MRKSRRKIYLVRQGIQGGFAFVVSAAILVGGVVLSAFLIKELKFRLTTCMTFTHIKFDKPIDMVRDVVYRYSLFGLVGITALALLTGKYLLWRIRQGISVLADEMKEFAEKGSYKRRDENTPYEVTLLRDKFFEFASEQVKRMGEVKGKCEKMREVLSRLENAPPRERGELLGDILGEIKEIKKLVGSDR